MYDGWMNVNTNCIAAAVRWKGARDLREGFFGWKAEVTLQANSNAWPALRLVSGYDRACEIGELWGS